MTIKSQLKLPCIFLCSSLLLMVIPFTTYAKSKLKASSITTTESRYFDRSSIGPEIEMGAWEQVPLPQMEDRMQGVHTLMLPNGKVLLANGSSNRNFISENGSIQNGINIQNFDVINNAAIFDPNDNSFRRIESPPVRWPHQASDRINDLFCSGQLHLPDGNVLFAGGTQSYYGQEQFQGSRSMQIFDWYNEKWFDAGEGADGHWYPSVVPLSNGQMMVISGISYNSKSKLSPWAEFYHPKKNSWKSIDLSKIKNSPWNTFLRTLNEEGQVVQTRNVDNMQMYPRIYPLPNEQFLITHDGAAWVDGGGETVTTFIMNIQFNGDDPVISFDYGPDRKANNRIYGTAVQDPINGDILLLGGQAGPKSNNSVDFGPGPFSKDGVKVVSDMERFRFDENKAGKGEWSYYPSFFGDTPEDGRIMLYTTVLPTKQMLIINGGNFSYHRPLYFPILATPDNQAPSGFRLKQMNQSIEPRLYHSISLLLPDGRVMSAGGNAARAVVKFKNNMSDGEIEKVLLNTYKDSQGQYHIEEPGENGISSEIWAIEIFKPPYMFMPKETKPAIQIASPKINRKNKPVIEYEKTYSLNIKNPSADASLVLIKLGSSTHAWDSGQRLIDLKIGSKSNNNVTFKVPKLNNQNVPGYYMLFYVTDKGQPSEAVIVQLT